MKRLLLVLVIVAAVAGAAFASAAGLGVTGGTIQAGLDASVYCDESISVAGWGLEVDDNSVRSVRIGDIASTCAGNEMMVQVTDKDGNVLAYVKKTVASTMETFPFAAPYLSPSAIEGIKVWIEGAN